MSEDWAEDYLRESRKFYTAEELLKVPMPPPLFHNLMPERVICQISAEPYTGKTLLCLSMALCLGSGSNLLGIHAPREKKRCLFIGQDAPTWDYASQLRKLALASGSPPSEISADFRINQGMDLLDKRTIDLIQEWHEASPFDVLFLDTLASLHSADENSTREMTYLMGIMKHLRNIHGITIIFTTHVKKPQAGEELSLNYRTRGSTVVAGSIDYHITLDRVGQTDRIRLRIPKGRGGTFAKLSFFDIIDTSAGVTLKGSA